MIAAVIATRYQPPQFAALTMTLAVDGVLQVTVVDGEHGPDWSLYRLWNRGVRKAIEDGAEYVCVLNDDVTILPGTLQKMSAQLELPYYGAVYPDYRRRTAEGMDLTTVTSTVGTWGAGGMSGFCFMFRADLGVPFDESYHFWYGDDAFEEAVRAKGLLVARIDGLPIDHSPNGSASRIWGELAPLIEADRNRWETRLVPA